MKTRVFLMLASVVLPTMVNATEAPRTPSKAELLAQLEAKYATKPEKISLREAHGIWQQGDALFFDVNTPELWEDGRVPGAVFFNVADWQALLPEDKEQLMVFYCANRMCLASDYAAEAVWEMGYTNIKLMPDGIYNWRRDGYPYENDEKLASKQNQ